MVSVSPSIEPFWFSEYVWQQRSRFARVRLVEMQSKECKFLVFTVHESNLLKMLILESWYFALLGILVQI
ncbi:hypothetical protein L1987_34313 [Smallanthus sonchifolius]|uniref:Uncharacterized protein n=1 Tax=Smallanthus sonchifolius TaxID=185202 RepID=A0ACB9HV74_9ASTR|nr:hypothetical protein L1987_34313 [Smallanthus sonchifolius]